VGAVDRALHELLNLDVYDRLGLEVDAYDTAPGPFEVLRELRRPLQRRLGRSDLANWNDHVCPGPAAAEHCSGRPPRRSAPAPDPWGSPRRREPALAPSPCPIVRVCERAMAWEPLPARTHEVTA